MDRSEQQRDVLQRMASRALSGKDSHVEGPDAVAGLDWRFAGTRPAGAPHTVFQLVNHISYWQEWLVKWLDGKKPRSPRHAAGGWPGPVGPRNRREWERAVGRFERALLALERRAGQGDSLARRGKTTRQELLHTVGSHTSYHVGQVVLLRQQLGAWPPPSGGVTW